ncbi:MAG: hypothetical protein H7328_12700 [Bdellovibrio sp.]|nr:hypothetical protein [Bdellovibrio sp.]
MIHYVLACVMWGKPDVKTIQIPVDDHGMAYLTETFGPYTFEASVMEETMNYMQIIYNPSNIMTQGNSPSSFGPQKSMSLRLNVGTEQASLDCEIK